MNVPTKARRLHRSLFKALDAVEGRLGTHHPRRVMGLILVVGLALTGLLTVGVWREDQARQARDFEVLARQTGSQVADRFSQRRWALERIGERWDGSGMPPAMAGSGWAEADIRGIRRQAPVVEELMRWQRLGEVSRGALQAFVQRSLAVAAPGSTTVLSPMLQDETGRALWLLGSASPALGGRGESPRLLYAVVDERNLLSGLAGLKEHGVRASLMSDAGPAALAPLIFRRSLSAESATPAPWLWLARHAPTTQSWVERAQRHTNLIIPAGAGLLCTVGALYAYLMLVSIRLRVQIMSGHASVELRREESRNRAVLDTAPDAIVMVDEQCRVVWCNQATVGIFGRDLDQLKGESLAQVLPVLDGHSLVDWFAQHGIANRVLSFETHGRRAEGTQFPIAVSASRSELEGEVIHTFTVRDTTDAKWAEHELLLRERALASSADAITICDMSLPGGPIIFVNASFERITGYAFHDVLGLNPKILYRDDEHQPGVHEMREAMAEGRSCQVVLRNYRQDGTMFWSEMTLSPVRDAEERVTHYVGVSSDITARMAAEQVLHLRTERLNAVFDLSPDGFVVLDRHGEVSIANPAFERMTGLSASRLVGRSHDELEQQLLALCSFIEYDNEPDDPLDHTPWVDDRRQGPSSDGPVLGRRELLHLQSPTPRTLVRRLRHGADDRETVMYFRDITHEREVDRMKSEFLSMAAHELRTPMASIFGFTELLLKRKFDEVRRQDILSTIHRQASILVNLINELLDLARIESRRGKDFKRQKQVLQPLIEAAVHGLLMNNDHRKVQVALPPEPIEVDVDAEKLCAAVVNVLSNAYKYSPKGGDIGLDIVWRDHLDRRDCGIRVIDHGIGMTPEQLARVFERFFRADTSGNIPGTGLGMTIVKEIIELHGGEVAMASQSGVGTTVTLWLPVLTLSGGPAVAQAPVSPAVAPALL